MNPSLIREAADHLDIVGLTLWSSRIEVGGDFNPQVEVGEMSLNIVWGVARTALAEMGREDAESSDRLWQVIFRTEARVIKGGSFKSDVPSNEEIAASVVLATLGAEFLIQYRLRDNWSLNDEALREFAQHNTPIHVWPYWREWLQSNATRVGLPPVVIGMHMLPKAQDAAPSEVEQPKALPGS